MNQAESNPMKGKLLNVLLIVASLFGVLPDNYGSGLFFYEAEAKVVGEFFGANSPYVQTYMIFPLTAQLLLVGTLFQKEPSKLITYIALLGLAFIYVVISFLELVIFGPEYSLGSIPYAIAVFFAIRHYGKIELV